MSLENEDHATKKNTDSESKTLEKKNKVLSSASIDKDGKETLSTQHSKRYLGGCRHKLTGKIYHHAMVQTEPPPWKYNSTLRFDRDAQTSILQEKPEQTVREASTQVEAKHIFQSTTGDKILESNEKYKCYEDTQKEYINKVITLQKYTRRWLAQKEFLKRKKDALLKIFWDEKQKNCKTQEDIHWLKSLEDRKLNPKSDDDFSLLFSDLQNWWKFQANCISEARSGADLKAAMWLLLSYEIKKIEEIHRKKSEYVQRKNSDGREMLLKMAAKPQIWNAGGKKIQVITKSTQRASYLHDLYTTLSMKHIPSQERVDALTNLKEFLQPYKCKLTDNLIQLINREIDLHLRGIKSINLEGLQTRIRDLIWQISKKPIFNPAMQKLSNLEISTSDGTTPYILCCAACKCFYILSNNSSDEATGKSVLENYSTKCNRCLDIENEAWKRKDLELYKRMLKILINDEERQPNTSSIIYILRPRDLGFLVENIWKHQSFISGSRKDIDLKFIRYDTDKNWTPWNCLLVTRQEAESFANILNIEKTFNKKFKKCVFQNHTEARRYFSTIPRFLPYLTMNKNE